MRTGVRLDAPTKSISNAEVVGLHRREGLHTPEGRRILNLKRAEVLAGPAAQAATTHCVLLASKHAIQSAISRSNRSGESSTRAGRLMVEPRRFRPRVSRAKLAVPRGAANVTTDREDRLSMQCGSHNICAVSSAMSATITALEVGHIDCLTLMNDVAFSCLQAQDCNELRSTAPVHVQQPTRCCNAMQRRIAYGRLSRVPRTQDHAWTASPVHAMHRC